MASISTYTGNAGLGLGSNPDIPAIEANPNLDVINQTGSNIRLMENANNNMLYQQKVKDRDMLLGLIEAGKVASGEIDPEDRKVYDAAEKDVEDAYGKIRGINDQAGIERYMRKVKDLKNVTTQAQHRALMFKQLNAEKAQKQLPDEIKYYDDHIQKEKGKDFWDVVSPVQTQFMPDVDGAVQLVRGSQMLTSGQGGTIPTGTANTASTQWQSTTNKNGVITNKTTTKTVPVKQQPQAAGPRLGKSQTVVSSTTTPTGGSTRLSVFSETPERFYDLPTMLRRAESLYLQDPKQFQTQKFWFDKFNDLAEPVKLDLLKAYNNRIADYSNQRGIQPDANGRFPDEVKYAVVNGRIQLAETPPSFFAKHSLASVEGDYVEKGQRVFNKEIADYLLDKEKQALAKGLGWAKVNDQRRRTNAYIASLQPQKQDEEISQIWDRNPQLQPTLATLSKGEVVSKIYAERSLPVYTLNGGKAEILKPIGAKKIYDKVDTKGEPVKESKLIGYQGGEYRVRYTSPTGQVLGDKFIRDAYMEYRKTNPKSTFDAFIKQALADKEIDYILEGENGTSDRKVALSGQKLVSNKATKKFQEGVFDYSEDIEE